MFYTIKKDSYMYEIPIGGLIETNMMNIFEYKFTSADIKLNRYLLKNYKMSLKNLCLYLVEGLKYSKNGKEIIITFKNKDAEKWARLITYGNEKIQGSHILNNIIMH